jgi:small subunit ribosomal protein S4
MAKNLNPKCKQCRRLGEKLFLKGERCSTPKCAIVRRNYAPGVHGPKMARRKLSEYGLQLQEKQKAKKEYNILENQFKKIFKKAQEKSGDAGENLFILLESRFDNVIYRLGFASSRSQARELISHGHFLINDKKVNIPSYQLKAGDIVKIKERSKKLKIFSALGEKLKKFETPAWLHLDAKEMQGKILHTPKFEEMKTKINAQMVVEFYSR